MSVWRPPPRCLTCHSRSAAAPSATPVPQVSGVRSAHPPACLLPCLPFPLPAGIIDEEEAVPIVEHVTNHDWPEQLSDYRGLAAAAGFAAAECLATDSKEFGRLVVLRK